MTVASGRSGQNCHKKYSYLQTKKKRRGEGRVSLKTPRFEQQQQKKNVVRWKVVLWAKENEQSTMIEGPGVKRLYYHDLCCKSDVKHKYIVRGFLFFFFF